MGDLILIDPDTSLVRFYKRDDEFERHALAGSAAAKDANRFPGANLKRYVTQNLFRAERFRSRAEGNCRAAAIVHRALSGNMKKMNLIKRTSTRMMSNEEITTLRIAARPTPAAPSFVVYPRKEE